MGLYDPDWDEPEPKVRRFYLNDMNRPLQYRIFEVKEGEYELSETAGFYEKDQAKEYCQSDE
jgi:hypothetical protein